MNFELDLVWLYRGKKMSETKEYFSFTKADFIKLCIRRPPIWYSILHSAMFKYRGVDKH
jgi:hypothetical protein